METIFRRSSIGVSTRSRKIRFRDDLLRDLECNIRFGNSSRLPFLKKVLCGQDTPDAETVSPVSWSTYDFPEGAALADSRRWISLFNASHADTGLQAFPETFDDSISDRYIVTSCDTRFVGDLKITTRNNGITPPSDVYAVIVPPLFQVFLNPPESQYEFASTLAHEMEHAVHLSLPAPYGPFAYAPTEDSEFLAILKQIKDVGDLAPILVHRSKRNPHEHPFIRAAERLQLVLDFFHGISRLDLAFACSYWSCRPEPQITLRPSTDTLWSELARTSRFYGAYEKEDIYQRVIDAAGMEYEKEYRRHFGLSLDDIREIVSQINL
jgi:hypothetical protein